MNAEATPHAAWPFHPGEHEAQARAGVRGLAEAVHQFVRPYLPPQHQAFYASLPFMVAAARDEQGRPWATALTGAPGFAHAPDPTTLRIDAQPTLGDALDGMLQPETDIGLLGIELATRRRNRINGRVVEHEGQGLRLEVGQTFGN
nr:pyridoxamine 5'-phosphate oxidase family protein [Deltaproteobacteria bacterium]